MRVLLSFIAVYFGSTTFVMSNTVLEQPGILSDTDSTEQQITRFIDNWHIAASKADAQSFFGAMSENSVYIGTDAKERWTKSEFMAYAKPYFDRGKAWTFHPYDRDIHLSDDGQYVWFSELLTTRMGICRGSGIIRATPSGWKIEQYHLSVTVPNDLMQDFIKLVDDFNSR
jgi:hypothetical protein